MPGWCWLLISSRYKFNPPSPPAPPPPISFVVPACTALSLCEYWRHMAGLGRQADQQRRLLCHITAFLGPPLQFKTDRPGDGGLSEICNKIYILYIFKVWMVWEGFHPASHRTSLFCAFRCSMRAKSGNVGETMSHTNCVMLLPEKMSVMGECLGYFKCSQKAFSRLGIFWYYEMWRYFSFAAAPATTFFFFYWPVTTYPKQSTFLTQAFKETDWQ